MANLQNERTKKLIFMGFKELLNNKAFSKITINEIAEEAMIHRSTFYTHFDDKYDLLRQYLISQRIDSNFDNNEFFQHPFTTIATINKQDLLPIFKSQNKDFEFRTDFFQFVMDTVMSVNSDKSELDKFFFIGRIKAINLWIDKTHQPYNPFEDFEYLDKIFQTGKE